MMNNNNSNNSLRFLTVLVLALFGTGIATLAAPGPPQDLLSEKIVLLGSRLIVSMPAGSCLEPRGHDIMGAPEPPEDESRVVWQKGAEKLVLMAYELHAYAGKDFAGNVRRLLQKEKKAEQPFVVSQSVSKGGLPLVLAKSEHSGTASGPGQLLESAFVSTSDGSVQLLAMYANPEAMKNAGRLSHLSESIFASLSQGTRQVNPGRRTVTLGDAGAELSLPPATAMSIQNGPDFTVYRFFTMKELASPETSLGIYVGGHPSFHEDKTAKSTPATILGTRTSWFESKSGSSHRLDALVSRPDGYTKLHLFISAPDEAGLQEMKQLAEAMSVTLRAI
jgi:hypothetical protein